MGDNRRARLRLPDTTVGQILTILLGGLVLTLLVILLLVALLRPDDAQVLRGPHADALQVASVIEALRAAPQGSRTAIAAAVQTPGLHIYTGAPNPACPATSEESRLLPLVRALDRLLPEDADITVHHCPRGSGPELITVRAADLGLNLDIEVGFRPTLFLHEWMPLIGSLIFLFILVAVLSVWAVRRIIGPLQRLSDTVERFGLEVAMDPLAEEGPREIRQAARSFNLMQQRVTGAVHDRTRLLAAVSHDLRTPITRMRLRVELEQSGEYRAKTLRDLDLMQQMISSALDFLRGAQSDEPMETVELGSLLETLCEEAAEGGSDIAYLGQGVIYYRCRPNALSRAINNLVENACRYGLRARVDARLQNGEAQIDVIDDGPGIADHLQRDAIQPFSRLDSARSMGQGVGLGLAIVSDIARLHGGRLQLLNRPEGGLRARLALPCPEHDRLVRKA